MLCTRPFYLMIRGYKTLIACGKCINCRKVIAHNLAVRIKNHIIYNPKNFFLTLTYDNDQDDYFSLSKLDIQLFIKRLRKHYPNNKITYFLSGEYGERYGRPHYHLLIFGLSLKEIDINHIFDKMYSSDIEKIWFYGFNNVGLVEEKSIRYVTGYIIKRKYNHKYFKNRQEEFCLFSKGLGIDDLYNNYDEYKEKLKNNERIPRYYQRIIKEKEGLKPTLGFWATPNLEEAFKLVKNRKEKNVVDALGAIPRRNKQLEKDHETLQKIYQQRNAL